MLLLFVDKREAPWRHGGVRSRTDRHNHARAIEPVNTALLPTKAANAMVCSLILGLGSRLAGMVVDQPALMEQEECLTVAVETLSSVLMAVERCL